MILCSINRETKTLTLTSLMRDMRLVWPHYVDTKGKAHTGHNRINMAYNMGYSWTRNKQDSMDVLESIVQHNFGVPVERTIEIDFDIFMYIVDRLGGVTVDISQEEYDYVCYKEKAIAEEIERLKSVKIGAAAANQEYLASIGSAPLKTACSLAELLCRPELSYEKLAPLDPDRKELPEAVREQVEINIRYEGYIQRQKKQVSQFEKLENKRIPAGIDYDQVESLRLEARQKLKEFMPSSIGQASRISGVTPADVSVLLIYLEKIKGRK
jgi:hypothetical protein